MLENIVKNPIETPRGYKNPDNGIALRGPLSQFFSALYLKPSDDAFDGGSSRKTTALITKEYTHR